VLGPRFTVFTVLQLPDRPGPGASVVPSAQDVHAMGDVDTLLVLDGSVDRSSTHADARNVVNLFAEWFGGEGRVGDSRMRCSIARLAFIFLFLGTSCAAARGDGGAVCMSGRQGSYVITVFSAPTPLRAGPIDISVLVQDARSGDPVTEAQVSVRLT